MTLAGATRMSHAMPRAAIFVCLFPILASFRAVCNLQKRPDRAPTELLSRLSLFSPIFSSSVRVSNAYRLSHLVHVILAGSGRAASNGLISSRFGILPSCIDIAARERRICALIALETLREVLLAGRHVKHWRLYLVVDPVPVEISRLFLSIGHSSEVLSNKYAGDRGGRDLDRLCVLECLSWTSSQRAIRNRD